MQVRTPSLNFRKPAGIRSLQAVMTPLLALALILMMTACSSGSSDELRKAIVGKWINEQNYSIEFYDNGTGFIPGVEGEVPIPATDFSYVVTDAGHIQISMGELTDALIEIRIEGDQMTWFNKDTNTAFVYTRSK